MLQVFLQVINGEKSHFFTTSKEKFGKNNNSYLKVLSYFVNSKIIQHKSTF